MRLWVIEQLMPDGKWRFPNGIPTPRAHRSREGAEREWEVTLSKRPDSFRISEYRLVVPRKRKAKIREGVAR